MHKDNIQLKSYKDFINNDNAKLFKLLEIWGSEVFIQTSSIFVGFYDVNNNQVCIKDSEI